MDGDSGILAVRTLNHWRTQYIPSYVGLRLLVKQLPQSKESNYLESLLQRKMETGELCRYRKFRRFKELDFNGDKRYRYFYAASPSSALFEAYILKLLSKVDSLANRSCVFSYRWPKSKAEGGSYRHFLPGYKARQQQVSSLLRTNSNYVVLVNDIRSFYPSISRNIVSKRLQDHVVNSPLSSLRKVIVSTCEQLLKTTNEGIPIGPALSHVFGNIALEPVDEAMYKELKERYLRYVDDILMVVEANEVNTIQSKLKHLIDAEGLSLHNGEGKHDLVTAQEWLGNIHTDEEQSLGKRFDDLRSRLRIFLNCRPGKLELLQKKFKEIGIPMPLQRSAEEAGYGRFQWFMRPWVRESRQRLRYLFAQTYSKQEQDFVMSVAQLSIGFVEAVKQIDISDSRKQGMVRRMKVQRLRYLLYRLLYLTPIDRYQSLLGITPEIDEFYEYRSLVRAIISGRLDTILLLPGPTLAMFASLCRELGLDGYFQYDESVLESEGALDSVCTLAAFGLMTVPEYWIKKLSQADSELVRFCLFSTPHTRTLDNSPFEDEIRTLQLGTTKEEMRHIINTRFDDRGSIDLEDLLFSEYPS